MKDYRYGGKWVGNENCTNPEKLYESIIAKPEDLFQKISYSYLDGTPNTVENATSASSKIRSYFDTAIHGRCYTFKPTEEMLKSGIIHINLNLTKSVPIYFHTNGIFETNPYTPTSILASPSKKMYLDLDFIIYSMLDIGGKPCVTEPGYEKDSCTESKLDKTSLEKFGCTTPFGPNKDKICKDHENGSIVMELYSETMDQNVDNCYSPCLFVSAKAMKTSENDGDGYVYIDLKKNIQVIEAHYLYSGLSMIAEVGGYVGLFLGVSVNQVSALVNAVLDKFDWIFNRNTATISFKK